MVVHQIHSSSTCPPVEHEQCCSCLSSTYPQNWDDGRCCGHCTRTCDPGYNHYIGERTCPSSTVRPTGDCCRCLSQEYPNSWDDGLCCGHCDICVQQGIEREQAAPVREDCRDDPDGDIINVGLNCRSLIIMVDDDCEFDLSPFGP